jgi:hypothetical protein
MATVDSDKVVCGGIHAMIVAVLVWNSSFISVKIKVASYIENFFI